MGIVYEFMGNMILFRAAGELTNEKINEALEQATKDPRFNTGMCILMEDKGSDYHPSSEDAHQAALNLKKLAERYSPHIAVVVKEKVKYGIGRMIAAYCEQYGVDFQVFRDVDNAREWLALVCEACQNNGAGPS